MGIIKKLLSKELNGLVSGLNTEIYPITAAEAVFDKNGTNVEARLDRLNSVILNILSGEGLQNITSLLATNYLQAYIVAKSDEEAASKLNRSEKTDIPTNYSNINNILMKDGHYLYMTTCRKRGTTYLTYSDGYIWSNPIRMGSGYTTSYTGNDGDGYNYIYCRTLKDIMPNIPSGLNVDKIESLPSNKGIDVVNSNIINDVNENTYNTWCDHPLGVTKDYPFEWVAIATGSDSKGWSDFTLPVRWSNYGFNGMDGDGVEYIFKLNTSEENPPIWGDVIFGRVGEGSENYYNVYTDRLLQDEHYQSDDFIPYGWHDNPQQMTNLYPILYVAIRRKKWEVDELLSKWLMFTTPKIWTNLFSGYAMTSDNDTAALDDNTVDAETIKIASEALFKVFFGLIEITSTCTFKITRNELPPLLDVVLEGNKAWLVPKEDIGDTIPTGTYNYVVSAYLEGSEIISKMVTLLILDITVDGSTYKLNITNDNWAYTDSGILLSTELSEISVANIFKGDIREEEFTLVDSKDNLTKEGIEVIYPKELEQLIDFENKTIIPNPIMNLKGYDFRMYYKGIIFDSEHIDCLKNGDPGEKGARVNDTTYYYKCAINTWKPDWNPSTATGKDAPKETDTWSTAYTALKELNKDPKADGTYVIWLVAKYTYSDGNIAWGVWELNEAASRMGTMSTWIGETGIYSGTIAGDLIVAGTIDAVKIKTDLLVVGENIKMGPNAKISWDNVTSQPTIPSKTSLLNNDSKFATTDNVKSSISSSLQGYLNGTNFSTVITKDWIGTLGLAVGSEIAMGPNAKISWSNVTSLPTIPSKVSSLTNDSGFLTATLVNNTITSKGYQTSSQVESAITSKGYLTATQVSNTIANSNISWNKVTGAPNITYTPRTIYRTASSLPSTPSGTNPSGWSTTPPSTNATKTIYIDFIINAEATHDKGYISAVDNDTITSGGTYKSASDGVPVTGLYTATVSPGSHSIYVQYSKDISVSKGDDCFKVKMRNTNLSSGPTYVTSYDSSYPWSLLSDGYYKSSNENKDSTTSTMQINFSIPLPSSDSTWVSVEELDSNGNNNGWSTPVPFGSEGLNLSDVEGIVNSYVPTYIDNLGIVTTYGTFYGDVSAKTLRAGTDGNYMMFCSYDEARRAYKDYNGTSTNPTLIGGSGNISGTTMVILIKSGSDFFVLNPLDLAKGATYTRTSIFGDYTLSSLNSYGGTEKTVYVYYKDGDVTKLLYTADPHSLYTGIVYKRSILPNYIWWTNTSEHSGNVITTSDGKKIFTTINHYIYTLKITEFNKGAISDVTERIAMYRSLDSYMKYAVESSFTDGFIVSGSTNSSLILTLYNKFRGTPGDYYQLSTDESYVVVPFNDTRYDDGTSASFLFTLETCKYRYW